MQSKHAAATSIKPSKVIESPFVYSSKMNCLTSSQQNQYATQGASMPSSPQFGSSKELPRGMSYTHEQIVAFGGIQEEVMRGVQSSGRLRAQPNNDATQMERAMMIAKNRAELPVIGTTIPKPPSITAFSDEQIIGDAMSLGVSFGNSKSASIQSAKLIKEFEIQRTLTLLKCRDPVANSQENDSLCLAVSRASALCHDLDGDDDFLGDDVVDAPPIIKKDRKTRKKNRLTTTWLGGALVLDLNPQNFNDES
jgi:hypothetical protein